jgi:hypothetical protein
MAILYCGRFKSPRFCKEGIMATINEDAEVLKSLVKSGSLQIDALETAARVGKESEIALRMIREEDPIRDGGEYKRK